MSKLFAGGVPAGPDLEKLLKEIAVESGSSVDFSEVAKSIGVGVRSNRFRTVSGAWRKKLFRERGLQSKAEGGVFYFLTASQSVDRGVRDMHRVGRALGRVHAHVAVIDPRELTEEKRAKQSLLLRESQAMLEHARKSAKAITGPSPVQPSLRIAR